MPSRRWVTCPICNEPEMRAEPEGAGWLVHCVNIACPSNQIKEVVMQHEVWDPRTGDAYTKGLLDGVARFSYTSSQPWAENGVRYVGTTGTTLFQAQQEILRERDYQLPEPYALREVLT